MGMTFTEALKFGLPSVGVNLVVGSPRLQGIHYCAPHALRMGLNYFTKQKGVRGDKIHIVAVVPDTGGTRCMVECPQCL